MLNIDDVLNDDKAPVQSFSKAEKAKNMIDELQKKVNENEEIKKVGRPKNGKSKAKNKIAFYVDDEQLEFLENLTTREDRTPNAVVKKIFLANYKINSQD